MTQTQIQTTTIEFKELFAAVIGWQLNPNEFMIYCQLLHQAIPQRVGGLCTQTVLALSAKTKIELAQVQTAIENLVNSRLIIRHELIAIKRISYQLTAPSEWLVANTLPTPTPVEIKTDRYFGEKQNFSSNRNPNLVFCEGETPWLEPPPNRRSVKFNEEFLKFQVVTLLKDPKYSGLPDYQARSIIRGYFNKTEDAVVLAWESYQEWLSGEAKKKDKESDFNPLKDLSLAEHEELIAQKTAFGDEQFADLGKLQADYLNWTRRNTSEYKHILNQIKIKSRGLTNG